VTPTGQVRIGDDIDPNARPTPLLAVNGAMTLAGSGGNVPHSCRTDSVFGSSTIVLLSCAAGEFPTGGGGGCDNGALRASQPANNGWEITCENAGNNRVYVVCCSR